MATKIRLLNTDKFTGRVIDALAEALRMPYEIDDSRMTKRFEADGRNFKSPKAFGMYLMSEINDWYHEIPVRFDILRSATTSEGFRIFEIYED